MSGIFTTTLRLNLENADDRRAYDYLWNMDRTRYRSYSSAIVTAINDHFSRRERLSSDPFLEARERQAKRRAYTGVLLAHFANKWSFGKDYPCS